ncbi:MULTISPECIES: hypothetical protein [unclassified Curtobacterium]|uniref:hypothetical protein n=1 Tax=unclassified Curtobacterium TaxID=257496 RepID=UPI0008241F9D|nr:MULTISPECIES: hypothetical protein [unclassified Curtobacterium]WIB00340.1 hypothetical protein QOL15_01225 [Curtobacterium sp. MCBA15_012]
MANGFKIDKRQLDKLTKELQREFNKRPLKVPVQPSTASHLPATAPPTVIHQHGPAVTVNGDGAQLAWGNTGPVHQTQHRVETIAPGLETVAQLLATIVTSSAAFQLSAEDEADLRTTAGEALAETTLAEPDEGKLKKSIRIISGLLAPLIVGVSKGVSDESANLARETIQALSDAVTS